MGVHLDTIEAAPDRALTMAALSADAQGKFVALFTLAPSAVPRIVTLQSVLADGRRLASAESVVLAPTPEPPAAAAVAEIAEPSAVAAAPVEEAQVDEAAAPEATQEGAE